MWPESCKNQGESIKSVLNLLSLLKTTVHYFGDKVVILTQIMVEITSNYISQETHLSCICQIVFYNAFKEF